MTPTDFLSRLDGVKRSGDGRWMARCPAHQDRTSSLSVKVGTDGRLLLHCFGCGGSAETICDALGLAISDLFPPRECGYEPRRPERALTEDEEQDRALRDVLADFLRMHRSPEAMARKADVERRRRPVGMTRLLRAKATAKGADSEHAWTLLGLAAVVEREFWCAEVA